MLRNKFKAKERSREAKRIRRSPTRSDRTGGLLDVGGADVEFLQAIWRPVMGVRDAVPGGRNLILKQASAVGAAVVAGRCILPAPMAAAAHGQVGS